MGHVLRHDGLLHDVLEGRMLRKRTRGRRRIQLIDDLLEKKNKATVDSRLHPQSCCHLPNCIEMQETVDCKLDQLVGNQNSCELARN